MTLVPWEPVTIPALAATRGRPREYHADRPATSTERDAATDQRRREARIENIAILDFETDPFDETRPDDRIEPFAACLHSDNFDPIIIWEENFDAFVEAVLAAINSLPEPYTIYAHNGGKFDYLFLVHKLRGKVSFKGRGLMAARIGAHELRDSFHIIPEKLANLKKDDFDYKKMRRAVRHKYKDEILRYLVNDCRYLLPFVQDFVRRFGFKLSVGQAAMAELSKHYKVGKIGEHTDATLRQFFYGGRVECLAGKGWWKGRYKLYDVNSMYPYVMAHYRHPISSSYTRRRSGPITDKTVFLEIHCRNHGAFPVKDEGTHFDTAEGMFFVSIHEYKAAVELGLISRVQIMAMIDNEELSSFDKFVLPIYADREKTKRKLATLAEHGQTETQAYLDVKKDNLFFKLLLNNAYGKFAQNPRRFRERYITGADDPAPPGFEASLLPEYADAGKDYAIWAKPAERMVFNNVGTAASITGAARSVLMRAIHHAADPIYCDTDSLICKHLEGDGIDIHPERLGAWDIEKEISEVIINGKKLYAYKYHARQGERIAVKSKGAAGVTWDDMVKMYDGQVLPFINPAPTFDRFGGQHYLTRRLQSTTEFKHARREAPQNRRHA